LKKNGKRISLLAAVLAAILLVISLPGKQKVWTDLPYGLMQFEGGRSRDTAAGDAHGVMNGGPGLTLPAGMYRLKWLIESDGNNRLEIVTENGVQAVPGEMALSAQYAWGEAEFAVETAA